MSIILRRTLNGNATFPLRIGEQKFVDVLAIPIEGPATQWGAKFAEAGGLRPTPGARIDLPMVGAIFPPQAEQYGATNLMRVLTLFVGAQNNNYPCTFRRPARYFAVAPRNGA
jgi:hypothetical protein